MGNGLWGRGLAFGLAFMFVFLQMAAGRQGGITAHAEPGAGGDAAFEAMLSQEAFPESYKAGLRQLHALYPAWVFRAFQTGIDWAEAVNAEMEGTGSLVESSSISSWKSTDSGKYNWESGTWPGFDGAKWVAASREIVSYYMDPRNFLDERGVFQFLLHGYDPSVQSLDGIRQMVQGTFLDRRVPVDGGSPLAAGGDGTAEYAEILLEAAQQSQLNPYVLASMILQEQGTDGRGGSISGSNGYYNYLNVGAYASGGMGAVERGLWYASQAGSYGRPWDSIEKSILGGAEFYAANYVNAGQNTLYLKKWNVQGENRFQHQYMTNVPGAAEEGEKLGDAYKGGIRSGAHVFSIPVYQNMPDAPSPRPTGDGSPDNRLSSLSVEGFSLQPAFSPDTLSYALTADPSVGQLTVQAQAMDGSASVSGTGARELPDAVTSLAVSVTAQNGNTRTYALQVTKQAGGALGGGADASPVDGASSSPDGGSVGAQAPGEGSAQGGAPVIEAADAQAVSGDGAAGSAAGITENGPVRDVVGDSPVGQQDAPATVFEAAGLSGQGSGMDAATFGDAAASGNTAVVGDGPVAGGSASAGAEGSSLERADVTENGPVG